MKYILILMQLGVLSLEAQNNNQQIPEVVISASRIESEKKTISQNIEVIKKDELRFNSAGNTGDALQNTGMITVQQSQNGGGSPIIRGFEANRIGVVVDGVRMNTAIFRGGHLQNVMRVDNGALDKIEVLYGAGSTQYGSDALGGVLNFVTIKPQYETGGLKGSAFARFTTSSNEKTGGFTLNYGTSKFASATSFTYSDFGNVIAGNMRDPQYGNWGKRLFVQSRINGRDTMLPNANPNEQINSSYQQYNIIQKFAFRPTEHTEHLFNFQYSNSSDVPRYDRLTEKQNNAIIDANPTSNRFSSAEWYYGPEARLMAAYTLSGTKKNKFIDRYIFTGAYQNYKESRNTRNFQNLNHRSQRENVDVVSLNFDLFKTIGDHQLSYGLEGVRNWVGSSVIRYNINTGARSYASTRYPDGGSNTANLSIYIQDQITLTKDLAYLNLGGRIGYNTISATVTDTNRKYGSFEITNPSYSFNAGLSILPTKSNRIYLNISSGYRTPNLDDMTKVFDNATWIQVNDPNVKPELAINYELRSWNKIGNKMAVEFGGYYTRIQDYITNEPTKVNGQSTEVINGSTYTYQRLGNAANAYILGAYGEANMQVHKAWNIFGNFNYTYGRMRANANATETPLDHIPPMSGTAGVRYKTDELTAELSTLWNGAKRAEDYNRNGEDNIDKSADPVNGFTPAWTILNLRTAYNFSKHLTAQAAVENIFDTHYRVFASGISSVGRNLRLTVRANF